MQTRNWRCFILSCFESFFQWVCSFYLTTRLLKQARITHLYFCVSKLSNAQNWRIFSLKLPRRGKETSLVLHRGIKSNFIPPVTYLHRSTNAEQPHSINARRLSFPRWPRYLNQNISQKCSRDDHKMTLGGLHGRGMVHSSGVGAPMVPKGQVIHHQQRCRAQQRVTTTISQLS